VASWCDCACVRLSDGDPTSVALLERAVDLNRNAFGATAVDAALLLWGENAPPPLTSAASASDSDGSAAAPPLAPEQYDVILCADCVYDRALHVALRATLKRYLKPHGVAINVASRRCGSLADFESCVRSDFAVENWGQRYDVLTSSLLAGKKCHPEVLSLRHPPQSRPRK